MAKGHEIREYALKHGISDYEALKILSPVHDAEQQGTPTPRTDAATAGVDFFITDSDQRAYSATDYECLRDEMKKLEREFSRLREDYEMLREALLYAAETFRQINEGKHDPFSFDLRSNMRSAAGLALEKTRAALAATRKEGSGA